MTGIGMAGDFIYGNNEYALRTFSETDYHDDEVVNFNSRQELENYIKHLMKSPNAWPAFGTVANLYLPNACIKSVKECDQEIVDFICNKLYKGDLVLVIRKYHDIKDIKLEACCVDLTKTIINAIKLEGIVASMTVVLPFFKAFVSPVPGDNMANIANMVSSTFSVATEDWKALADAINSVHALTKIKISSWAAEHSLSHHNNRKIKQLWEGISDVFAK